MFRIIFALLLDIALFIGRLFACVGMILSLMGNDVAWATFFAIILASYQLHDIERSLGRK